MSTKNAARESALRIAADLVAKAREFDRRNDATMRDQTIRSIEAVAGLSRADIKRLTAEARK